MNFDIKNIEWIERYLEGKLPDEERRIFEEKMKSDKDFAQMVDFQRAIVGGIVNSARLDFKKKLEEIHQTQIKKDGQEEISKIPKRKRRPGWKFYLLFVLVLLLLVLIWFFGFKPDGIQDNETTPEKTETQVPVATPNYKPVLVSVIQVQTGSQSDSLNVNLMVFETDEQATYTFDGQTLVLMLPKHSVPRLSEINFSRINGNYYKLTLVEQSYPVTISRTLKPLKGME